MKHKPPVQLSFKVILIVALLIPINTVFQMQPGMAHMSTISLLYNTISILFILTLVSHLIDKFVPHSSRFPGRSCSPSM